MQIPPDLIARLSASVGGAFDEPAVKVPATILATIIMAKDLFASERTKQAIGAIEERLSDSEETIARLSSEQDLQGELIKTLVRMSFEGRDNKFDAAKELFANLAEGKVSFQSYDMFGTILDSLSSTDLTVFYQFASKSGNEAIQRAIQTGGITERSILVRSLNGDISSEMEGDAIEFAVHRLVDAGLLEIAWKTQLRTALIKAGERSWMTNKALTPRGIRFYESITSEALEIG